MSNEQPVTIETHPIAAVPGLVAERAELRARVVKLEAENAELRVMLDDVRSVNRAAAEPHCEPGNPAEDHPAHVTDVDVEAPPWPRGESFDLPK